jgi:DNA-binding NarL/FixJ family response regulator
MTPRTLLLVEDERESREALARAFTRAGYLCLPAAAEDEALALAARHPLDAAVLDIRLGDDDRAGLRLVRALREGQARVPVVLITAFADLDKVKQALNDGASFLLEKPFKAAELLAVVARVLSEADGTGHLVERAIGRAHLTEREATVARLLLKGLPSAEIATLLANSDKTVRQHISQIYAKCGVSSRAEFFHHIFPS